MALYGLYIVPEEVLEQSYNEGFALKVKELMSRKVITADSGTPAHELADIMVAKRINRLPIVEDGKILGIVSRNDLLRAFGRK
jgi:CBS domain-containing protein